MNKYFPDGYSPLINFQISEKVGSDLLPTFSFFNRDEDFWRSLLFNFLDRIPGRTS
jgi:hypothetical protein